MKGSRRTRGEAFDATAPGRCGLEHVASREPLIRGDFQSAQVTEDCSMMTSVNKLATRKPTGWAAFFHCQIALEFIKDDMMGVPQTLLIVFEKDGVRGALDAKTGTGVSAKRQIRTHAGLALDHSVGVGAKNAAIRNIDGFADPRLKGGRAIVGVRSKIERSMPRMRAKHQ